MSKLTEFRNGLANRGFVIAEDDTLIRCLTVSESFQWDIDTFLNKLDAFEMLRSNNNTISKEVLDEFLAFEQTKFESETLHKRGYLFGRVQKLSVNAIVGLFTEETPKETELKELNPSQIVREQPIFLSLNQHLDSVRCDVSQMEIRCLSNPVPEYHLCVNLVQKTLELNRRMYNFSELLAVEWGDPEMVSAEQICVIGRLCSDSDQNIWNDRSVILDPWSKIETRPVRCFFNNLSKYSLFPGQIVALRGTAATDGFYVDEILPFPGIRKSETWSITDSIKISVYSGPFVIYNKSTKSLDSSLFDQLISRIGDSRVVLLMGPFIEFETLLEMSLDAGHDDIHDIEAIFIELISSKLDVQRHKFILVSSLRDGIGYHYSCPQPPFDHSLYGLPQSTLIVPNPAVISINGLRVAITTIDILSDMNDQELFKTVSNSHSDKTDRLLNHLLDQRSFYPLFPPALESNINYSNLPGLDLTFKPDIFILSSKLKYFVKVVDNVVCVNPGCYLRGLFAEISVHPTNEINPIQTDLNEHIRVDILRS